jgi:ABC-type branched-subunit amino acid transport system substrate-binding protein
MHPDLIYFAGYANDASILLANSNIQNGSTTLMGGDALFVVGDYTLTALSTTFRYFYFTSFAYINPPQNASQKTFWQLYQAQFDPKQINPQVFSYSQPDSVVILTNDAINVLIKGYQNAVTDTKSSLVTPNDVRIGLSQINSAHPFSGVSGQIAFDKNGNPINKTIVMLHGDTINDLRIEACNTRSQCPKTYLEASV